MFHFTQKKVIYELEPQGLQLIFNAREKLKIYFLWMNGCNANDLDMLKAREQILVKLRIVDIDKRSTMRFCEICE